MQKVVEFLQKNPVQYLATVGYGIAPYQLLLADYTAGQELHLAPKTVNFFVNYL